MDPRWRVPANSREQGLAIARPIKQLSALLSELRRRRRTIAELQWQLARFISHHPGGGNLAA